MAKTPDEYYISRKGDGYDIAKFDSMTGGEQPKAVYHITVNKHGGMKCDCPAAMYHGTGENDKHVKMVKEWLAELKGK